MERIQGDPEDNLIIQLYSIIPFFSIYIQIVLFSLKHIIFNLKVPDAKISMLAHQSKCEKEKISLANKHNHSFLGLKLKEVAQDKNAYEKHYVQLRLW